MNWLSKLQNKQSHQGMSSKSGAPTPSLLVLEEYHLTPSPDLDLVCRFLDALPERNIKDYDPGQLGHDMYIGSPDSLAVFAAKINSVADICYRNEEYANADIIYSLQIKLLLACLKIRFRFWDTSNSLFALSRDHDATEILSYLSGAYFNRGNTYDEMNTLESWQKALADYEQALRYGNPEPWDVYFNMGLVYEKMGDIIEARTQYLQSRQGAPASKEARVQRALARLK